MKRLGTYLAVEHFSRALAYLRPHGRYVVGALAAALLTAVFYSATIGSALPVLKIMIEPEGVDGWLLRSITQQRLNVTLATAGGPNEASDTQARVIEVKNSTVLRSDDGFSVEPLAIIHLPSTDTRPAEQRWPLFRAVSTCPRNGTVTLSIQNPDEETTRTLEVTPDDSPIWAPVALTAIRLLPDSKLHAFFAVAILVVVINLVGNLMRFISEYLIHISTNLSMMDLRNQMYAQAISLPIGYFSRNISDTISRFIQDTQEIHRGIVILFSRFIREPLKAVAVLILGLVLAPQLMLIMILVGPIAVTVIWLVGRKIRKYSRKLLEVFGYMLGAIESTLGALRVVKAYTAEPYEKKRFFGLQRQMVHHQIRIGMIEAAASPAMETLGVMLIMGLVCALAPQVIGGQIEPSRFFTMAFVLGALVDPIRKVANVYNRIQRAEAASERAFDLLDAPVEQQMQREDAIELSAPAREVSFDHVTFTYPGANQSAVRDVSFTVPAAGHIAIVGPNGSGKTTLVSLLPRFFDVDSGTIRFDDTDISKARLRSLRSLISVVTQDSVVFPMSVAENIAYGLGSVEQEKIIEAARQAYAHEFISELPEGYDTRVGERGATLSGGQKQRIALARAILRAAPILIFDEATSQIDYDSEQKINQALREFTAGRTVFTVAHRLSTVRNADRVLVMEAGKLVADGTHDELIEHSALYRVLMRQQLSDDGANIDTTPGDRT